jgi:hypothetical protein
LNVRDVTISPSDAAVATRSFPRRWRGLFAMAAGDDEHNDVLERSGALRMAAEAAAILETTADRIRGGLPSARGETVLEHLDAACEHLARAIDNVAPDDWAGARIEALTQGIEDVASLLRKAERAIEDAR